MNKIDPSDVKKFVKENIEKFHKERISALEKTNLKDLLKKKNPYLFKAKNITTANELITSLLNAKLSASEEEIFGGFLEDLAIFIAETTLDAHKSSTRGVDLEYDENGNKTLMTIKSGLNWGNSGQWKDLETALQTAVRVLKQSSRTKNVRCILGVCYGKARRTIRRGIEQICGQEFWHFLSGDKNFYKEIVEPLGYQASQHNAAFE